ncbi:hypothetical protein EDD16DRAFT_1487323, partial [Pisolithus croceorrhizus]
KHLYSMAVHMLSSDQSHYQLQSQIWATFIMLNPPTLWITLNPCNFHDPITQVFAGEDINMDDLLSTMDPCKETQACNIAGNPYSMWLPNSSIS